LPPNNYAWHPIGPAPINVGGVTTFAGPRHALAIDQTTAGANLTMYLGAANGGVWKTINNGASWTPLTDFYRLRPSAQSPSTRPITSSSMPGWANRTRAATAISVEEFSSHDGGATWTTLGAATFGNCISTRCAAG